MTKMIGSGVSPRVAAAVAGGNRSVSQGRRLAEHPCHSPRWRCPRAWEMWPDFARKSSPGSASTGGAGRCSFVSGARSASSSMSWMTRSSMFIGHGRGNHERRCCEHRGPRPGAHRCPRSGGGGVPPSSDGDGSRYRFQPSPQQRVLICEGGGTAGFCSALPGRGEVWPRPPKGLAFPAPPSSTQESESGGAPHLRSRVGTQGDSCQGGLPPGPVDQTAGGTPTRHSGPHMVQRC